MTAGRALAAVLATLLSACGSGSDVDDLKLLRARLTQLTASGAAASAPLAITRASIDAVGKPLLLARVEQPAAMALLGMVADNGRVVTWASVDGLTISLSDGVVIATRGFADDLMSATTPTLAQLAQGAGTVSRTHYGLAGGDLAQPTAYRCTLTTVGSERLAVYEVGYTVRHVRETCEGDGPAFGNDYWIEVGGKLRQSRQWIGQTVGYVQLQLVSR